MANHLFPANKNSHEKPQATAREKGVSRTKDSDLLSFHHIDKHSTHVKT
jgi:hypothetical protein